MCMLKAKTEDKHYEGALSPKVSCTTENHLLTGGGRTCLSLSEKFKSSILARYKCAENPILC